MNSLEKRMLIYVLDLFDRGGGLNPHIIEFEWVSSCCLTPNNLLAISLARTIYIQWNDDDVRFVLD
jgi:hypothetical protein